MVTGILPRRGLNTQGLKGKEIVEIDYILHPFVRILRKFCRYFV